MTEQVQDWRDGYRAAVVEFLMANGQFVEDTHYPLVSWRGEDDPTDYDEGAVQYGWSDYGHHYGQSYKKPPVPPCRAVSADASTMRERSLSQFTDTFHSNEDKVGVEVRATCACGKYTDKWLRWEGSVGEILPALLEA